MSQEKTENIKENGSFYRQENYSPAFNSLNNNKTYDSPNKSQRISSNNKHFDTAYHQMLLRVKSETNQDQELPKEILLSRLLLSEKDEEKLAKSELYSKKYQMETTERLMKQATILKMKQQQKAEDLLKNQLKECSFHPKILVTPENENHRSLTEFLTSQDKFLQQKHDKIVNIKSQINENDNKEKTLKPQLCPESLEILQKKQTHHNNQPAFERLYALNKKIKNIDKSESFDNHASPRTDNFFSSTDKLLGKAKEETTFKPSLNKKSEQILKHLPREGKIEERLYKEHFKNEKKLQQKLLENQPKMGVKTFASANSQKISQKLVAEGFLKEFQEVSQSFLIKGSEEKLDYLSMCEIIKLLGFVTKSERVIGGLFERERTLVFELWWALKGHEFNGTSPRNLCLFLLGILGLAYKLVKNKENNGFTAKALPKDEQNKNYDEEKISYRMAPMVKGELIAELRENEEKDQEHSVKSLALGAIVENSNEFYEQWARLKQGKIYGRFDKDGSLELFLQDIQEIHKKFQLFYRNRLSNESLKKIQGDIKDPTFEPCILSSSKKMAFAHREKLAEKTQEYLKTQALDNKIPGNGEFSHADLLILSKEAKKLENTKKNKNYENEELNECTFHPKTLFSYEKNSKNDRNLELYSLSKNKISKKPKDSLELEFEKNCQECTFQPDLKKNEKEISVQRVYAKNIDKFINRMRNSQKEREYVIYLFRNH